MDLIANSLYKIACAAGQYPGVEPGLYRVVLDDPKLPKVVMVLVHADDVDHKRRGGRNKKLDQDLRSRRKKPPAKLIGELLWIPRLQLQQMWNEHLILQVEQDRPTTPPLELRSEANYRWRIEVMTRFLRLQELQEQILVDEGLGGLVREAMCRTGCSRSFVYRQWSNLCRWGITEHSLWPQRHRCGAPGIPKTCDLLPDGRMSRKKAGRKTIEERGDLKLGRAAAPTQPGMSALWAARIRAADNKIPNPKPVWPKRHLQILESHFCTRAVEVDGKIQLVLPTRGTTQTAVRSGESSFN